VQPVDDLELVTKIRAVLQIKTMRDQIRMFRDDLLRLREAVRRPTADRVPVPDRRWREPGNRHPGPEEDYRQIVSTIRRLTSILENEQLAPQ